MLCGGIFHANGNRKQCVRWQLRDWWQGCLRRLQADPLTVKTEQGKAHGKTINDGKVKAFLGLPYAAPPVGDLRWKAPQPPVKWKGVRDATRFGAHCAQGHVFDDMIFQDSGAQRGLPLPERLHARRCQGQEQAAGDVLDSRRRLLAAASLRAAP